MPMIQVLRIKFSSDYTKATVVEVYVDDGHQLSDSSVAVYHKSCLLIGSVMRELVHCEIADPRTL